MINDFTFLYGTPEKVNDAFGALNSEMLLKGAKRIFGGREQVFFEYARDESQPYYDGQFVENERYDTGYETAGLLLTENGNAAIGLDVQPVSIMTGDSRYEADYIHGYCRTPLLDGFNTFETKKYFSIDLSYILSISRAMTTYDFSQFDGEGLRILKAWLFVMTYGVRHPEDEKTIMVQSSKNEYGEEARNRVITRNLYFEKAIEQYSLQGSPYGESNDDEWALRGDDYPKVAALDKIFNELSKGTPLYYEGSLVPDLIKGTRQYADLVPEYLQQIFNMQEAVNSDNFTKK